MSEQIESQQKDESVEEVKTKRDVTAREIYKLLQKRFDDRMQWLCAGEVADKTGFGNRRLDFVAVNCYESNGCAVHAFEIKISKSDLRKELENPQKHNIFFENIDTYSIVAPDYVLDAEYKGMIPHKWGIYVVSTRIVKDEKSGEKKEERFIKVARKPIPFHDESDITMKRSFAISLLRALRNQNAERMCLNELLKEQYEKGRADAESGFNYHYKEMKRKLEEEEWKFQFVENLHLYTRQRANEAYEKIVTMLRMHGEISYLERNIKRLEESLSTLTEVSKSFKQTLNGEELDKESKEAIMRGWW